MNREILDPLALESLLVQGKRSRSRLGIRSETKEAEARALRFDPTFLDAPELRSYPFPTTTKRNEEKKLAIGRPPPPYRASESEAEDLPRPRNRYDGREHPLRVLASCIPRAFCFDPEECFGNGAKEGIKRASCDTNAITSPTRPAFRSFESIVEMEEDGGREAHGRIDRLELSNFKCVPCVREVAPRQLAGRLADGIPGRAYERVRERFLFETEFEGLIVGTTSLDRSRISRRSWDPMVPASRT